MDKIDCLLIDCLLEEICPTSAPLDFLFPTISLINTGINSVNRIIEAIRSSDLSNKQRFFLNSEIHSYTTSANDSFPDVFIDYFKEKHG